MKARIGIASEELVRKYILDISGGKIKHVEGMPNIWFTSLTELSQVLTNDNICSGQLKLATVLEFSQYNRSDSLGVKPPLY
ncbi:transcriptional regulator [Vibrio cholerae]|nr:transcriptional regulator [Vibrio cholerae]